MLENRDYTLIIDKSGSMATRDQPGGRSRWEVAKESTLALAAKCEEFDPDGITIYLFSGKFRRYDNTTAAKVIQIYRENDPSGSTNLTLVLKDALDNYFNRKRQGKTKENGEIILVITDGEPDDRRSVYETIVQATKQMDRDEELGISFIQVGNDPDARSFLKALDDRLVEIGAKFDIVDTVTLDEMEEMSLSEVLLNAILD